MNQDPRKCVYSRREPGKYKVVYGSDSENPGGVLYEFEIERLRDYGSNKSWKLDWYWFIYGTTDSATDLISKKANGLMLGGHKTMREALVRIPSLVQEYEKP